MAPPRPPTQQPFRRIGGGFTIVELLIAVVLLGVMLSIALPAYTRHIARTKVGRVVADMRMIELELERYVSVNGNLPATLAEAGLARDDPWGNPYRYLRMAGAHTGQVRKDRSLHPLNTDYDLYSMGPDGRSVSPLTAAHSRDDIVRASNGGFIGSASDF